MTLTDEELKALLDKAGKATPGERRIHLGYDRFSTNPGCYGAYLEVGNAYNLLVSAMSDADKDLAVAANPDTIKSLVTELLELRESEWRKTEALVKIWDNVDDFARAALGEKDAG